jgi:CO/xanthine dehydrogenase Mo-binding subunit
MDAIARELVLDPFEVRRRNALPPDAFPYDARPASPRQRRVRRALDEATPPDRLRAFRASRLRRAPPESSSASVSPSTASSPAGAGTARMSARSPTAR